MQYALRLAVQGILRADSDAGLIYQRFSTSLYTYERPVGMLRVNGYVGISLGYGRQEYAHRLLWTLVEGPIPAGLVVNHINAVKHDNRRENLELLTDKANHDHARSLGLILSGDRHPSTKLTDEMVKVVRERLAAGVSTAEIAAEFSISSPLISNVRRGIGRFATLN
jgi:hypothetical protein